MLTVVVEVTVSGIYSRTKKIRSKVISPSTQTLNRYSGHHLLNLHAALTLGVRSPKLGLIKAVDAFGAVLLDQTAFTDSAASGTNSSVSVPTQNLPFF